MAFTTSNGRTQIALSDINVTPLVDVVLVLLIIFMVTAPVLQSGIEVNVPKTQTVKEITEERLVISIDKSQRVFLATIRSISTRLNELKAEGSRSPASGDLFRSDQEVPFGAFATVMDAIKQSGISNVSIVTQPIDSHASIDTDIYSERGELGRPLAWSFGLHVGVSAFILLLGHVHHRHSR